MRRSSLLTPLSVLFAGFLVVALLIFEPEIGSFAAPNAQATAYPEPEDPYPGLTSTAAAAAPGPTVRPVTETPTASPTQRVAVTPSATLTPLAITPTQPIQLTPTPTPDESTRTCTRGETVAIRDRGPANAGILVYFNNRIVSGGTVRRDGTFDIALIVGNERAGIYPVEVRVRGTRNVLAEFTCQVPATTPTPRVGQ